MKNINKLKNKFIEIMKLEYDLILLSEKFDCSERGLENVIISLSDLTKNKQFDVRLSYNSISNEMYISIDKNFDYLIFFFKKIMSVNYIENSTNIHKSMTEIANKWNIIKKFDYTPEISVAPRIRRNSKEAKNYYHLKEVRLGTISYNKNIYKLKTNFSIFKGMPKIFVSKDLNFESYYNSTIIVNNKNINFYHRITNDSIMISDFKNEITHFDSICREALIAEIASFYKESAITYYSFSDEELIKLGSIIEMTKY